MKVIVYTTMSCPFCDSLEAYLKEKNIEFEERRVDESSDIRKELESVSDGFLGVPYTHITKDDGTHKGVIGFDKNKLNEVLGIS